MAENEHLHLFWSFISFFMVSELLFLDRWILGRDAKKINNFILVVGPLGRCKTPWTTNRRKKNQNKILWYKAKVNNKNLLVMFSAAQYRSTEKWTFFAKYLKIYTLKLKNFSAFSIFFIPFPSYGFETLGFGGGGWGEWYTDLSGSTTKKNFCVSSLK